MAIWVILLQLVLAIMGRCTPMPPFNATNRTSMPPEEASGTSESEVTSVTVSSFNSEVSTNVRMTSVSYTSVPDTASSKPPLIRTIIMDFISQYMVFIIIIAATLVLLLIVVCTVIFTKLRKGSAYYPSSFPTKKYVDEQDKRGSSKNFEEVTGMVSGEPREDTVSSTEQLQSDILSANHNLKKKAPSKGEERQEVGASGKGEPNQAEGKEGRDRTGPEAGTNQEGQMSDSNTAREPEKDQNEKSTEQEDKKGGIEGAEKEKDKMELETGVALGHSLQQPSSQAADKPHFDADAASDKAGEAGGQEPKEVKFAEQGVRESSSLADHCKDLEDTPLILKPSDTGAL